MYLEIDEVAVSGALWERVKAGDQVARDELKNQVVGLQLSEHAFGHGPELQAAGIDTVVTLRELAHLDLIFDVRIEK